MMKRVESWLTEEIGLDPNSVGPDLIARAIQRRFDECRITNEGDYLALLHSSEYERQQLIEETVVPETWFFRDQGPFRYLQTWAQGRSNHSVLRIASVPCSQGEEPYSIAIALFEAGYQPGEFQIDGYDISLRVLQKAHAGFYRTNSFRQTVPNQEVYFQPQRGGYQLRDAYRSFVNFEWGNLLDPTFGRDKPLYDVIFCRNLLIYLDAPSRKRAAQTLDRLLAPNGLLFAGAVEALQSISDQFESVREPMAFVYRRKINTPKDAQRVQPGLKTVSIEPRQKINIGTQLKKSPGKPAPQQPSLDVARELSDQGRLQEARTIVENYIETQAPDADAFYLHGLIQQASNEMGAAEESYLKALFLQPLHTGALAQMALLRDQRGDRMTAERFRRRLQRVTDMSERLETTVLQ